MKLLQRQHYKVDTNCLAFDVPANVQPSQRNQDFVMRFQKQQLQILLLARSKTTDVVS